MQRKKVFISSVQSEFATERQFLFDYLTSDALLGKFFEPFIFENVPALNTHPATVFLKEVEKCDIYLGIFGEQYGYEDSEGISPTEREFDAATKGNKTRLVYVKQAGQRHPKEELLIRKAENVIVRRSFSTPEQLKTAVYASLINYLIDNEIIRTTPFDATLNHEARFDDLDEEKIRDFVRIAHRKRSFPFTEDSDIKNVLTHLNLMKSERITNAALLLFGRQPQRFFITSEVKCAHFHGLTVSKPIPSYQVYKGNVFEMIEKAVDFVLSKINLYVGDRSKSVTVDVSYEIPKQAVTEAIVNAVAHRDYTSNASVQVMLFADRLEVSNPGSLPHELTIDKLYTAHRSIPANPLIAEAMYLRGTIERMGTGTVELVHLCTKNGLGKPAFVQEYDFRSILYRPVTEEAELVTETVEKTVEMTVEKTVEIILNMMIENPQITQKELAKKTGLTRRGIEWNLSNLKIKGLIERIGTNKSGHWKVAKVYPLQKEDNSVGNSEKTVEETVEKTVEMTVEETVGMTVEKILNMIMENPQITQKELAKKTGLTRRGIEWNLSNLKIKGLIERIGSNKSGHWKIKANQSQS